MTRNAFGDGRGWYGAAGLYQRGVNRVLFLLNHSAAPVEVPAADGALDLLSGARTEAGEPIGLDTRDVRILWMMSGSCARYQDPADLVAGPVTAGSGRNRR